jgi:hypothetical protein
VADEPNIVKLTAVRSCKFCRGHGWVYESHGMPYGSEQLLCDCVLENAPSDERTQAAIDSGNFEVVSTEVEMPDDRPQEYGE